MAGRPTVAGCCPGDTPCRAEISLRGAEIDDPRAPCRGPAAGRGGSCFGLSLPAPRARDAGWCPRRRCRSLSGKVPSPSTGGCPVRRRSPLLRAGGHRTDGDIERDGNGLGACRSGDADPVGPVQIQRCAHRRVRESSSPCLVFSPVIVSHVWSESRVAWWDHLTLEVIALGAVRRAPKVRGAVRLLTPPRSC